MILLKPMSKMFVWEIWVCALNIKGKLDWMKKDIEVSHLIDILHESMFKKENVI